MLRSPLLPLLLLLAVLVQAQLRPLQPGAGDPLRLLDGGDGPQLAILTGQLLSDPVASAASEAAPAGQAGPCRVLLQTAGGRSELSFGTCPALREGWDVRVSGQLRRPRPAPHPLLAGPAERLARHGSWTRLTVERLEVLRRPATPIADLRRSIAARFVAAAGPERGGLLAALVLGSAVVPLPAELRADFRVAGLSHALAASGFHLSVLLGAVLALGRGLGRSARLALGGGAMALFLLLAGAQPSVVRAVLMGAIALVLLESGRRGRPLGILGLSLAGMLLLRPAWLHDVGFQLSAAATAGLVLTARPLEQALAQRLPGAGWLAPALAVPLAASLWTLPLQLLHFGVVPLYAVPANLLAAPLLTPLTLGAMALALVAVLVPPLLAPLLVPLGWLAALLLQLAHVVAGLPLAQWQSGRPLPLLVLLFTLALLGLVLPGLGRRRRLLAAGLGLGVLVLHLVLLGGDQLLLVHQGEGGPGRDLLLARHRGRAALVSTRADGFSCRQAGQLAQGLGVARFDWALLLDPVAGADPACWSRQAARVVAYGDGAVPLAAGQRLASRGLAVQALAMDSHALRLQLGHQRWLLLPDRQSLASWRSGQPANASGSAAESVWLGFRPRPSDHRVLLAHGPRQVWLSGPGPGGSPLPPGWRASGASGALAAP
ncbi:MULTISPECIES: ComEC/Rec2 family competence protein [unclassified Cyanobium]|uniref:ComEC/Rec2 family competence protein n=1 Tax=unclassified Cyanobium TaxID=2627006 RepID=UPI0020CD0BEE|nr:MULTISPECIES: ComEC/Rec2 family competence protein [unclassified Cyanobium]MCP9833808.1 ComEC/Rec2 family competence protein [Cyanobium sp. La Preciosa 7G6]MCP9936434.1 ComEC/Rec2 family competence protein [Cyanobium sp. Aljojuca 7A6]